MGWVLLVYRVPTEPASRRGSIRRDLKSMGALDLQQCVYIVPNRPDILIALACITTKIRGMAGEYMLFDIPTLRPGDEARITQMFRSLQQGEHTKIIEE